MIIPVLGSQVENSAALVDVMHLLDDDLVILSKLTKAPPPPFEFLNFPLCPFDFLNHFPKEDQRTTMEDVMTYLDDQR